VTSFAAWMGDRPASAAAEPSKSALRSYGYKELVLVAKSGSAATIQDDKENNCDLTGAGQSNFSP
jgi:hypothetical protein